MSPKDVHSEREIVGFLGIGLDNKDGHHRSTRSEHFILLGGSQATHEHMQDTAIRFSEALERKGKALRETSVKEAIELLRDAIDS